MSYEIVINNLQKKTNRGSSSSSPSNDELSGLQLIELGVVVAIAS